MDGPSDAATTTDAAPIDAADEAYDPFDAGPTKYVPAASCAVLGTPAFCDDFENGWGKWASGIPAEVTLDDTIYGSPTHALRATLLGKGGTRAASRILPSSTRTVTADILVDELPIDARANAITIGNGTSAIEVTVVHLYKSPTFIVGLSVRNGSASSGRNVPATFAVGSWFHVAVTTDWAKKIKVESNLGSIEVLDPNVPPPVEGSEVLTVGIDSATAKLDTDRIVLHVDNVTAN